MIKIKTFDWAFFKKALKVIIPIVLSQVIVVAISFVDGIMVNGYEGHSGFEKVDYAAVGAAGELWFGAQAFYAATMVIFSILYSQFANNKKIFTDTAKYNFWFAAGVTFSVSAVMYFAAEPIINLFFLGETGADVSVIKPIAYKYFKIMALGNIFISASWALLNPLTIKGKTAYALYLSLVSLILNFVLDYIFIYKMNLGAEGSAWATIISYFIQLLLSIYFVIRHREWFVGFWTLFSFNSFVVRETNKRLPIFFTFILMQIGFAASTVIYANLYSSDIIKPMTVGYTVSSMMFTVLTSINRCVKVFIGPLLGKGKFNEAQVVAKKLLWPNVFLSVIFTTLALISTSFFPGIMLNKAEDITLAKNMIYVFACSLIAFVIVSYYSAIIETSGSQLFPNILNYFFQVWVVIPLIFIFSPLAIETSFAINFLIAQFSFFVPGFILYMIYRKKAWLRRIAE